MTPSGVFLFVRYLIVVINMYFHNGDFQPKTVFNKNDCTFEEVYVFGLSEGHYLKSEIPYFFSSSNGHLSVSNQTKTFGYYDQNHLLIETISLTFITECQTSEIPLNEQGKQENDSFESIFLVILFIILILIIFTQRRQKHAKNRIHR